MRRNPDAAPAALMVGRDGRLLPFDGSRLGRSLAKVLRDEGPDALQEADDLVDLVRARLGRRAGSGPATADEVGQLAAAVLEASGHQAAATRYRRRLEACPERIRARVRHIIADATDLPGRTAWDVAREVQAGLAASGLQGARSGLILEWVDHALRRRGLDADVGRRSTVGVTDHELRDVLARGAGGLPAELRAAQALLTRHALDHVLPAEVAGAHDEGRIDLSDLMGGCRIPGLRLPPGRVSAGRPAAASSARLRSWAALTSHELAVPWGESDPGPAGAEELLHQLELPGDTRSPVVLCIPADQSATARTLGLARVSLGAGRALPRLRIHGPFDSSLGLCRSMPVPSRWLPRARAPGSSSPEWP